MRCLVMGILLLCALGCAESEIVSQEETAVTKTQFGEAVSIVGSWHWKVEIEAAEAGTDRPSTEAFIEVDQQPKMLEKSAPIYPEEARENGIEGEVWVQVLVDLSGRVAEARILEPAGKNVGFEKAALQSAINTTWEPARAKEQPVSIWVAYEVQFRLREHHEAEG